MCRRIFKEQTSETGDIPFYKIGTFGADPDAFISRELFEEYKSKYPYPQKGDILISASGSIGRAVEFAGNNEYFQDSNIVWLNHDERLSNPFLKCFYSVVKWAGIEGSTIKRLYNDNILNTVICMPSVPEQKRIGLFFENLDNLITLHQRQPFLHSTPEISLTVQLIHPFYTSSWEQRKFSDVVATRRGLTYKPSDIRKNGVRVLRSSNIAEDSFVLSDEDVFVVREAVNIDCVRANDILITAANGSSRLVGKHTIISGIPEESAVHGGFMLLGTTKEPHFVNASMGSSWYRRFIELFVAGGNGAIGNLNKNDLDNQDIAIPSEKEQKKIGSFFRQLDNLITLHQRKCVFLFGFFQAFISMIFTASTFSWEQRKLSEIADKVTEKNAGLQYVETFTNSAEFGIISQRDFFDHDIAKLGSLDGYYIVKNEDFVYNPRISTSAPVGPINRNKLGRTGVMSPLYTVFRPHDVDTTYLEHFFKCAYWHSFMNFNGDSGARSDRFSIKDDVFFQMPIPLPYIDEQRKIGELLTRLDHLITLHQRKGKAAVTGCSNDANNSKGVYCKARDFGYKCCKKVESP